MSYPPPHHGHYRPVPPVLPGPYPQQPQSPAGYYPPQPYPQQPPPGQQEAPHLRRGGALSSGGSMGGMTFLVCQFKALADFASDLFDDIRQGVVNFFDSIS